VFSFRGKEGDGVVARASSLVARRERRRPRKQRPLACLLPQKTALLLLSRSSRCQIQGRPTHTRSCSATATSPCSGSPEQNAPPRQQRRRRAAFVRPRCARARRKKQEGCRTKNAMPRIVRRPTHAGSWYERDGESCDDRAKICLSFGRSRGRGPPIKTTKTTLILPPLPPPQTNQLTRSGQAPKADRRVDGQGRRRHAQRDARR
jgi:hypothetical protein